MKFILVAIGTVFLCGVHSTSAEKFKLAKLLFKLRCKNNWDCKTCDEIKRQGRCNAGYLMGVCYKTCTGCAGYIDEPTYDCASIKKQGKCFAPMIYNQYIKYAMRCEATCCKAEYPLSVQTTFPTTSLLTTSLPKTYWNQWTQWGQCSKTCHKGYRSRSRTCSFSREQGVDCIRPQTQYVDCNVNVPCKVDGGFGEWSEWTPCSATCAFSGSQSRSRSCTNPRPQNGGRNCVGASFETRQCNTVCCPEQGGWSYWSTWGSCSITCWSSNSHYGKKRRSRSCTNPPPVCGGGQCIGPSFQTEQCLPNVPCGKPTKAPSPYWTDWGPWEPCSATCYVGYQVRRRYCIGYQGYYNYCDGMSTDYKSCNTDIPC